MCQLAFERDVTLHADNGVNLNFANEEALESLVRFKFRSITVSIDGVSQDVYSRYRRNGQIARVFANIDQINGYKSKYKSPWPMLTWQYIIFAHNVHEIEEASSLAKHLKMAFFTKSSWDESLAPDPRTFIDINTLRSSRSAYKAATGKNIMRHICTQLWHSPVINWDGRVLGCCRNFWGEFGGNAFETDVATIVNNERLRYARSMLTGQAGSREDIPCTDCELYKDLQNGKWITADEIGKQGDMKRRALLAVTINAQSQTAIGVRLSLWSTIEGNDTLMAVRSIDCKEKVIIYYWLPKEGRYTLYVLPSVTSRAEPSDGIVKEITITKQSTKAELDISL